MTADRTFIPRSCCACEMSEFDVVLRASFCAFIEDRTGSDDEWLNVEQSLEEPKVLRKGKRAIDLVMNDMMSDFV